MKEDGYLFDLRCISPEEMAQLPDIIRPVFSDKAQFWFRNFEKIFVALSGEDTVRACQPDLHVLAGLESTGVVVTGPGAGDEYDFVSRYLAPGAGIPDGSGNRLHTCHCGAILGRKTA